MAADNVPNSRNARPTTNDERGRNRGPRIGAIAAPTKGNNPLQADAIGSDEANTSTTVITTATASTRPAARHIVRRSVRWGSGMDRRIPFLSVRPVDG